MGNEPTKRAVWERWVTETVLADIDDEATPDPVVMIDDGADVTMTDAYDAYRLGRGEGDYLYLLYLLEAPGAAPTDIVPVYVGETGNVASRLLTHFRKLRDALPISAWEDDGSWGSYGKYDHIATVYDRYDAPLCVWVEDVDTLDVGPYGYPTYRQELEAKLVDLVDSYPAFERVFANRDFVPNRIAHEMGNVGPAWVDASSGTEDDPGALGHREAAFDTDGLTKSELWFEWVDRTIHRDIVDSSSEDPIALFATDDSLVVDLDRGGSTPILERSAALDARIRREGKRCVHRDGVKDGAEGLLYVMFQLASDDPTPQEIVPRYIGKAEAYGKQNELSANFEEIAKDREATRSFARWGDGSYWHVGELSETVFGVDSKKTSWAAELFEEGTHRLEAPTYLWIRAWDSERELGPYGYPVSLAAVEALLIGLAYAAFPEQLLNHKEVPESAPANRREYGFEPADP